MRAVRRGGNGCEVVDDGLDISLKVDIWGSAHIEFPMFLRVWNSVLAFCISSMIRFYIFL